MQRQILRLEDVVELVGLSKTTICRRAGAVVTCSTSSWPCSDSRAERALRGAVIVRKVSHCSKNVGGADAFSAFTSVIRTLARNGGDHSLVNGLCGVFSGAPVPTPSF